MCDAMFFLLQEAFIAFSGKRLWLRRVRSSLRPDHLATLCVQRRRRTRVAVGKPAKPVSSSFKTNGTRRAFPGAELPLSASTVLTTRPLPMADNTTHRANALNIITQYQAQIKWQVCHIHLMVKKRRTFTALQLLGLAFPTQDMSPDQFSRFYRFIFHIFRESGKRNIQARRWRAAGSYSFSCGASYALCEQFRVLPLSLRAA